MSGAAKRSSGCRSASKKSGDWRCAERSSSLTSTLATFAVPSTLGFDGQLGSDLVELPFERPGEVANLEVDPRMNGIEVPGAGRGNGQARRGHRFAAPSKRFGYACGCKYSTAGCCKCKYLRDPTSLVFSVGSWLRSCGAGTDRRPGTRSCGHTPPSCAASRLIWRRRRD